ncbi:hypothetical protein [Candidatus Synechococcus spongiarum]|uniref:hypothetical protein n=1 Tax=Candidatus Synechococcus spongiarum TaxID=431041 RepID=UPI001178589A|nr:hypothetical protein [Candidatus Synechococcus spongiarum]
MPEITSVASIMSQYPTSRGFLERIDDRRVRKLWHEISLSSAQRAVLSRLCKDWGECQGETVTHEDLHRIEKNSNYVKDIVNDPKETLESLLLFG